MFEAAIAAQTRFWGGSANLIFPLTDDLTEREVFWALADVFDADAYVTYSPTWGEVEDFAPDRHAEVVARLREDMEGRFDARVIEEFIEQHDGRAAFDAQPTAEQLEILRRRLAPFHHKDREWMLDRFNGTDEAAWPFTDIGKFVDLPDSISNPISPAGAARKLLLTSTAGRIPRGLGGALTERGIRVADQPISSRYEWATIVLERNRHGKQKLFPWALSDFGLGRYQRGRARSDAAALVVGDTAWDFALFYALKRLTGMAWWLPSWLARDNAYLLTLGAALTYDARGHALNTVVVSSSSVSTRDRVARTINEMTRHDFPIEAADWQEVIPEEPIRVYERDNEGRTEVVQLVDGATLGLETPLPKHTGTMVPAEMRWLTEVQAYDWSPIRHPALGTQLIEGIYTTPDLMRTTRDGVAYFSTGVMIFSGASLESSVVRPTLRPLSLVDQLRAILEPQGWSCDLSDKGVYAQESMTLFGGFEGLCTALRDPNTRAIIEAYRQRGAPGRSLSRDSRRYLTWDSFDKVLNGVHVAETIDPLRERGVLIRGLVLKCARCRQEAWHHADTVGERFACGRCHLEQSADRRSWLGKDEPTWSYRLAEVLYQFLEHDGDLPVLAVYDEFQESERPLGQGYELDLTNPDGESSEIDIFSSDGFRLWIGEAKKDGRFESGRLEFLANVATIVDAYGVLLTTARRSWPVATREQARSAFKGFWPRVHMRDGVETGPTRPPPSQAT